MVISTTSSLLRPINGEVPGCEASFHAYCELWHRKNVHALMRAAGAQPALLQILDSSLRGEKSSSYHISLHRLANFHLYSYIATVIMK